jgi:hypothetical protein
MDLPSGPLLVIAPKSWLAKESDRPKVKMSFSDGTLHLDKDDRVIALLIESNGVQVIGCTTEHRMIPLIEGWDLSDDFWESEWNLEVDDSPEERS